MGSKSVFECDGPECEQTTSRPPKHEWPPNWSRLALVLGGGDAKKPARGSFCSTKCANGWVREQMAGTEAEPIEVE